MLKTDHKSRITYDITIKTAIKNNKYSRTYDMKKDLMNSQFVVPPYLKILHH